MEQLLSDAKYLAQRLQHHDNAADSLIGDASNLEIKLQAMKEYREEVTKLNDIAKHRPRSTLILGSQLENQRIRDLENENRELHLALADHQSTLELIMNKYREQVLNLLTNKGLDKAALENMTKGSGDINALKEKVTEMAAVMHRAVEADEEVEKSDVEALSKLKYENRTLRELLNISGHPKKEIERMKLKELVERERLFMNGDAGFSENDEQFVDSSGEELENQTGTVKRRLKGQLSNNNFDSGKQVCDTEATVADSQNGSGSDGDATPVKRKTFVREEVPFPLEIVGAEAVSSDYFDDFEIQDSTENDSNIAVNDHYDKTEIESQTRELVREGSEPADMNNVSMGRQAIASDSKLDSKKDAEIVLKNAETMTGSEADDKELSRRKQEEILELYNSEGLLLEENEETQSGKSADNKMSGIKIRRSTKQKKVIQADLKSFFETEGHQKNTEVDGSTVAESKNSDGKGAVDGDDKIETEKVCDSNENDFELSIGAKTAPLKNDENLKSIVSERKEKGAFHLENLEDSFSPIESPIESPDLVENRHRTVQLNYSDSDSDDPEIIVEDQFADIMNGGSCSDSSSEGSGLEPQFVGDDDDDVLEEQIIGDLDEGGEFAMSRHIRPPEECEHLDEDEDGDGEIKSKGQIDDDLEPTVDDAVKESSKDGQVSGRVEDNSLHGRNDKDFTFSEAYLQFDQFTGGSIEAKFAKRKRYKNGSKASAITLFAGSHPGLSESPRSKIRSDSDLRNASADFDVTEVGQDHLPLSKDSSADISQKKSASVSKKSSNSSIEDSSSGEIDPTIFRQKLAAPKPDGDVQSNAAANLTDLLSDLDAALELEDSD